MHSLCFLEVVELDQCELESLQVITSLLAPLLHNLVFSLSLYLFFLYLFPLSTSPAPGLMWDIQWQCDCAAGGEGGGINSWREKHQTEETNIDFEAPYQSQWRTREVNKRERWRGRQRDIQNRLWLCCVLSLYCTTLSFEWKPIPLVHCRGQLKRPSSSGWHICWK